MSAIITTVSGRAFDVWNPEVDAIDIEDIAHALSAMPRFAGHTHDLYPVAQHAIWLSEHMPPDMALYGLLKDAPHAYLMDLLGPYKREVVAYTAAEARMAHAAHRAFGLDPFLSGNKMLGAIDDLSLLVEWRDQKDETLAWWELDPERIADLRTAPAMSHAEAKTAFLTRFDELLAGEPVPNYHEQAREAMRRLRGWRPPLRPEIVTWTGRKIDALNPRPGDFDIRDIARSLARMPRFAGHTRVPYSVAEHSVFVASRCKGADSFKALLHDASEALFLDVPSPVKKNLPHYRDLEHNAQRCILQGFGLDPVEIKPKAVKAADELSCKIEMRDLISHASGTIDFDLSEIASEPTVRPVGPEKAEQMFLEAFRALAPRQSVSVPQSFSPGHG